MELNWYFTGLVLLVCVIHLAAVVGDAAYDSTNTRSLEEKGLQGQASKRGDWYVFFHCADLVGKTSKNSSSPIAKNQSSRTLPHKQKEERRSRIRARV